ncbi:MAG: hypothetical protein K0R60_602 [Microbacterium sp.]|nr:hypothetical protein [Microbacterium sp.]
MNDDLTPHEQAEMRDLVLAGAQRIRPTGKRQMRIAAGAIALVLIGVVSGGAITTAALLGSDARPAPAPTTSETLPTPSPLPTRQTTPTPTPTPTPTAPAPSTGGITPFGGECANALDEASVEAVAKIDMMLSDYRWKTGANEVPAPRPGARPSLRTGPRSNARRRAWSAAHGWWSGPPAQRIP